MAIMISVNPGYFVLFSGSQWKGYATSNGAGNFNLFDTDGNWTGYFVANSGTGLNLFDTNGRWIGFTT
jgi:hypothetical protein